MLGEQILEFQLGLAILPQIQQRSQFREDQRSIESSALPHNDALDVEPILDASGKCLQHDEIFRRARRQARLCLDVERRRPVNYASLERKTGQRDIDWNSRSRFDEDHSMRERKPAGVGHPRTILTEKRIDETLFAAEARQQRDIDVACFDAVRPTAVLQGRR
ncbi:MAG TPA: hypothetical protein VGQ16_02850 [Vicinamibacterales bacterium]|nr:hypothetical protein [Vicinamibacterales bacterium]